MKALKIIAATLAVASMALLAGCSDSIDKLKPALQEIATNTNGKITVQVEFGTWGRKVTFIFDDVNRNSLN